MKKVRDIVIILIIFMMLSCMNLYAYSFSMFQKQLLWFIIGFIMMFIVSKVQKKYIYKYTFLLYIIFNCLLLYLLLFGKSVNGSKAWIDLYYFSFQPSEFMKIILIILLSYISVNDVYFIFKAFILTLIPSILTFLEPDTGNVIFYLVILASILVYHGKIKRLRYVFIGLMIFVSCFILIYIFNKNLFVYLFGSSFFYRIDRVIALFNQETYQLKMALIGIGSSLPLGINSLVDVPEASTDFAFTLLIMRGGIISLSIYIIANICLNMKLLGILSNEKGASRVLIFVFLLLKLFQEGIHILMNIGLFPITGIPLPFISYGGSSLLSYFMMIGIIINNYKDTIPYKVS